MVNFVFAFNVHLLCYPWVSWVTLDLTQIKFYFNFLILWIIIIKKTATTLPFILIFRKCFFIHWYHSLLNSGLLLIIFANTEIVNLVGWKLHCLIWKIYIFLGLKIQLPECQVIWFAWQEFFLFSFSKLKLFVFQIHLFWESSCSVGNLYSRNCFL